MFEDVDDETVETDDGGVFEEREGRVEGVTAMKSFRVFLWSATSSSNWAASSLDSSSIILSGSKFTVGGHGGLCLFELVTRDCKVGVTEKLCLLGFVPTGCREDSASGRSMFTACGSV